VSAITFRRSGLDLAIGDSTGITRLYDLRSPEPIVTKDQGYGFAVQNIIYLESGTQTQGQVAEPKILTSDKRIIKLWDPSNGTPFTSVEPAVDLNHGNNLVSIAQDKG
jgi:ribosome biogenesis protein ENP2